jgi:hypothetical protein
MDPDPDPIADPTPFFIDFKDAKKNYRIFAPFFLITCPKVHRLQSKKINFLLKFCAKMLFAGIVSIRSTHL